MFFGSQAVVITGASSGIGWALAQELARQGCRVGLVARRLEKLRSLAQSIETSGGQAAYASADVGDRQQTLSAIQSIRREHGPADLLVANAGVGMPTYLDPLNVPDVEEMIRVNLLGVVYAIEAVLPEMLRRASGHIAAVSSLAAYKGLPGESGYCASKAAVNAYMEGLRIQLRQKRISVTTVCPGFVRTPMTEVNDGHMLWPMDADQAARLIVWALRKKRKVYDFPRKTTLVMKATRWLPDWAVAWAMNNYNQSPLLPAKEAQPSTENQS